jgi:crotonobetaine/carnitine-CoA ligase
MYLSPTGRESVFDVLDRMAAARPEAPFLVFEGDDGSEQQRTYAEMRDHALAAASSLQARRIGPGDRVHLHLNNCPEFLDCFFGAAALGAVVVPTNPLLTTDELGFIVDHAGCKLSVTAPDLGDAVAAVRGDEAISTDDLGDRALVSSRPVDSREPAAILYTSGTTSRPKGVLVTHANYLHVGNVVAGHLRVRREDRWLVVLPLFHANAQYYSTMSALVSGSSIALMSRFSASRWGRQAAHHRATLASLFAAPIRMLLAQPGATEELDNRLRAVIFSQNVTEEQLDRFEERFRAPLLQLYGMTETIAPPTVNPLYGDRRNLSIGLPTTGSRLRIVDAAGRRSSRGELLVGGVPGISLMAGYLDDPAATAAAIKNGWLHTGDTVSVDADGYLYFVDRSEDMIKRAGENVAASEVEAVANRHPDVFESAAVGVSDEMRDEAIKLFVVRNPGSKLSQESLIAYCSERLADFKVPQSIEFVETLPRTSVGKVRKELLRQREPAN